MVIQEIEQLSKDLVSTKIVKEYAELTSPRSELIYQGEGTGCVIDGAILEFCIRIRHFIIIGMTNDIPYEESLNLYLLDKNWAVLDSAALTSAYTTGCFSELKLYAPNKIEFAFFGGTNWTVTVYDKPVFMLPFFCDSPGVWRPFTWQRYFDLRPNGKIEKNI